jgi:hypothetical protein
MEAQADYVRNELLARCPEESLEEIARYFATVSVDPGDILYDLRELPAFVHFPITFTVSLVNALPTGHTTQIAVVGCEGAVGIGALLGGGAMATRAFVQTGGAVFALKLRGYERYSNAAGRSRDCSSATRRR